MPASSRDGVALVSQDPALVAEVGRLCAAAGQQLSVVAAQELSRPALRYAVVLVDAASGPDLPETPADAASNVLVLTDRPGELDAWQVGVRVGARRVLALPDDAARLLDALALAGEDVGRPGPAIGVIGGCGGAGASMFAAAMAWSAAAAGVATTLVDLDVLGGGLDLLLGVEDVPGLRWPDLTEARGVIAAAALRDRLPRAGPVAVLSCGRSPTGPAPEIPLAAASAVLSAARRADAAVVLDLPRISSGTTDAVLASCDAVVMVVPAEVRAVAAATLVLERVTAGCDDVRVLLRTRTRARLTGADVATALARRVTATIKADDRAAAAADRGELAAVIHRSRLAATAGELWAELTAARAKQ